MMAQEQRDEGERDEIPMAAFALHKSALHIFGRPRPDDGSARPG
jgi:hypothetical protein